MRAVSNPRIVRRPCRRDLKWGIQCTPKRRWKSSGSEASREEEGLKAAGGEEVGMQMLVADEGGKTR